MPTGNCEQAGICFHYVSNCRDLAFVTYVSTTPDDPRAAAELAEVSPAVDALAFVERR